MNTTTSGKTKYENKLNRKSFSEAKIVKWLQPGAFPGRPGRIYGTPINQINRTQTPNKISIIKRKHTKQSKYNNKHLKHREKNICTYPETTHIPVKCTQTGFPPKIKDNNGCLPIKQYANPGPLFR